MECYTMPQEFNIQIPWQYLKCRRILELIGLFLIFPLFIILTCIITLFILAETNGPAFFIQNRTGKNGLLFRMYKFRTMYKNSDTTYLTAVTDKRITRVGRVLRKYKLDELPQFINILKGEMSFIGPRPVPANFYVLYKEEIHGYDLRHIIRPGITGLAQLSFGYTRSLEEEKIKLTYDLLYIRNISAITDAKIIFKTISALFK